MESQQDIDRMADAIYRDKVLRARAMSPEQRLLEGFRLFDEALAFTKAGVSSQIGTTEECRVMAEVERRLEVVREFHDRQWFKPWPAPALAS